MLQTPSGNGSLTCKADVRIARSYPDKLPVAVGNPRKISRQPGGCPESCPGECPESCPGVCHESRPGCSLKVNLQYLFPEEPVFCGDNHQHRKDDEEPDIADQEGVVLHCQQEENEDIQRGEQTADKKHHPPFLQQ